MITAAEREPPDYPWEYFLECNERRYLSAGSSSQKPQRQSATRLRRTRGVGGERRLVNSSEWCHLFLLFSSVSFFFSPHYPLSRSRPSSSFYRFRRRQTVANRIRGPLFTRSPATLCLLLTNFGRSFLAPHLSFSFISLTKSFYQRDPRSLRSSTFS